MKCINKNLVLVVYILCFSFLLTGCGSNAYSIPYDPDTQIVAFTFDSNIKEVSLNGYASSLCVTNDNNIPDNILGSPAESFALFDINNKNTIVSKNANERLNPASLTKVMTALLALEYGNIDDTLTASANVQIKESGAQLLHLKEGDRMTLDQALHGLMLYSANDCGVLIAEYISGSVDSFAELMNQKAKSFGATNTHFSNPHGLTAEDHYTTAYDLYLIFNEALKYDKFRTLINTRECSFTYKDRDGNGITKELENTNGYLTGKYIAPEGVTVVGGKTGTTDAAGACLILLSQDNMGNSYISVILHDEDHDYLYSDMTSLLSDIP